MRIPLFLSLHLRLEPLSDTYNIGIVLASVHLLGAGYARLL